MYAFGLAVGFAIGAALIVIIIKMVRKATHKEGTWAKYDERQQAARGRAFRAAFFTMVILSAMAMCWYSAADGEMPKLPVPMAFLAVLSAGFLVFGSCSIWTDAYIGTNETYHSSVILFAVIGAANLGLGILNYTMDGWSAAYINLCLGALMFVLDIEMIAKNLCDRKSSAECEE